MKRAVPVVLLVALLLGAAALAVDSRWGKERRLLARLAHTRRIEVASESGGWAVVAIESSSEVARIVAAARTQLKRHAERACWARTSQLRFELDDGDAITFGASLRGADDTLRLGLAEPGDERFPDYEISDELARALEPWVREANRGVVLGRTEIDGTPLLVQLLAVSWLAPHVRAVVTVEPEHAEIPGGIAGIAGRLTVHAFTRAGLPLRLLEGVSGGGRKWFAGPPESELGWVVVVIDGAPRVFVPADPRRFEAPARPSCPRCAGTASAVIPIVYGMLAPSSQDALDREEFHAGGCVVGEDSPDWFCRTCERSF